jgi:hypothetical protein
MVLSELIEILYSDLGICILMMQVFFRELDLKLIRVVL